MSDTDFDEVDVKLLRLLDQDGEIDVDVVAEELNVSPSTVYYRLDKYRKQGILKGNIAELDPGALGIELTALTAVETSYERSHDEIAEELAAISGVQGVYSMFGEMSFFVLSRAFDQNHLQRIAESIIEIEGVENSVTNLVMRTYEDESNLLANYDDADLEKLFYDG